MPIGEKRMPQTPQINGSGVWAQAEGLIFLIFGEYAVPRSGVLGLLAMLK